jgi:hypothetical protein
MPHHHQLIGDAKTADNRTNKEKYEKTLFATSLEAQSHSHYDQNINPPHISP